MSFNVMLGQYIPGDSTVYRLNPVNKILFTIILMVAIVFTDNIKMALMSFSVLLCMFFLWRLPFFSLIRGMRMIMFFLVLTFVIHVFFTDEGTVIFNVFGQAITQEGIFTAGLVFLRLVQIILLNSILTVSTQPVDLAYGFEKILSPLKVFRFPAEDFALMLSMALRFIPVLMEELQKIIDAQKSRGADFDSGSFIKRLMSFPPVMIPLFINSFYKAEDIAVAMEARCYSGSVGRTSYRKVSLGFSDLFFFLFYIILAALLIIYR